MMKNLNKLVKNLLVSALDLAMLGCVYWMIYKWVGHVSLIGDS